MRRASNEKLVGWWLEGRADSGQSHTGSLHFKGNIMYSYGVPIAYRWGKYVLVNADRYSATTSRHEMLVYCRAWHHYTPVFASFGLLEQVAPLWTYEVLDVVGYDDLVKLAVSGYERTALVQSGNRKYLLFTDPLIKRNRACCIAEVDTKHKSAIEALKETFPLQVVVARFLDGGVVWSLEWLFVPTTNMYMILSGLPDLRKVKEEKNYTFKHPTAGTVWTASRARMVDGRVFVSGVVKRVRPPTRFLSCRGVWYEAVPANVGMVRREAV